MALEIATGSFQLRSGTGNQTVNISPTLTNIKAILFWWTRATADATFTADMAGGFGACVNTGGTPQQGNIAWWDDDNVGTTDAGLRKSITHVMHNLANGSSGYNNSATISSFGTSSFVINVDLNDDVNLPIIHYKCLGGSDITNAYFGEFAGPSTGVTGNHALTGVGFQGDLGVFFGANFTGAGSQTASDLTFWLGAAHSASEEAALSMWLDDNTTSANRAESYISDSKCVAMPNAGNVRLENIGNFVSWDSDGFTINYTTVTVGPKQFFGLILKGTFQAHVGTQARKITTTGTQDITTEFQPVGIFLAGAFPTALDTETVEAHLTIGAATSATDAHGTWNGDAATINSDCNLYSSADLCYVQATNPSTIAAAADLDSMQATGPRLNWTTVDANARLFWHLALGSAVQASRPMFRGS
jgi:hypothetical protein